MATLIKTDGTETTITPKGKKFVFKGELYPLLATDMIQVIRLADGRWMLMDEEAKLKNPTMPLNAKATRLLAEAGGMPGDVVLGDVVIVNRKEF